jgi:hypothetical protein
MKQKKSIYTIIGHTEGVETCDDLNGQRIDVRIFTSLKHSLLK